MRTFLRDHWKTIVAIVLLVLLATVAANPSARPVEPTLAACLHAHAKALAPDNQAPAERLRAAAAYIRTTLEAAGYAVHDRAAATHHEIEAVVANVAPGAGPARSFIVGARYDGSDGDDARLKTAGAAAVLELARLLAQVRPTRGTGIRFVFLLAPDGGPAAADALDADGDGFIAYAGTPASARRVQDALAAFQNVAHLGARGLATPAYMQGVTLSSRADKRAGAVTLVITDTAFTRFPYRHSAGDEPALDSTPEQRMYTSIARVVGALARTLTGLASGQQG
jgi:hypothetical protein